MLLVKAVVSFKHVVHANWKMLIIFLRRIMSLDSTDVITAPAHEGRCSIKCETTGKNYVGAGIAQWLEHRTRDWKVAGSNPCWNGGRIFFSRVDFLCWLLFRYPFHPRVTTVARKKSRSFCQKVQVAGYSQTLIHLTYVDFIEPCFGIGHNLSLICQMTSEDIKHQLIKELRVSRFGLAVRR